MWLDSSRTQRRGGSVTGFHTPWESKHIVSSTRAALPGTEQRSPWSRGLSIEQALNCSLFSLPEAPNLS